MAASDHFGSWLRKVLPCWAEPLWANTFRGEERRGRDEVGKEGQRGRRKGAERGRRAGGDG